MRKYQLINGEIINERKLLKYIFFGKITIKEIVNPDQIFFDRLFKETCLLYIIPKEYINANMVTRALDLCKYAINDPYSKDFDVGLTIKAIPGKFLSYENLVIINEMKAVGALTTSQLCLVPHNDLVKFANKCPNIFFALPIELFDDKEQLDFVSRGYQIIEKSNLMKLSERARIEYVGQNPFALRWLSDELFMKSERIKPYIDSIVSHINKAVIDKKEPELCEERMSLLNKVANLVNERKNEVCVKRQNVVKEKYIVVNNFEIKDISTEKTK